MGKTVEFVKIWAHPTYGSFHPPARVDTLPDKVVADLLADRAVIEVGKATGEEKVKPASWSTTPLTAEQEVELAKSQAEAATEQSETSPAGEAAVSPHPADQPAGTTIKPAKPARIKKKQ